MWPVEDSERETRLRAAAAAALASHLAEDRGGSPQPAAQAGSSWARAGRLELMRKTIGSLQSGG